MFFDNRMILHLVLVSALVAIASAQLCIVNPPALPLDVEQFSGAWYAQHRFGTPFVTPGCFRANYSAAADNGFTCAFEYKDRQSQTQVVPIVFEPTDQNRYVFSSNGTTFCYVLTRNKTRDDAVVEHAIAEARKLQPELPSPSKDLNCEIF
ncbi:unnamed protein product [Acanthoscelides obtectus]|uniref:Lipocalin/cytosolic fatty-acid binding domain-containing protein n=1 Tax=Acanthoscelides obtectus TaxID=200917 RepID=A0A9P0K1X9_ACAOB|nr:unnamed protein product [Acanthoscelides obtectus]CAK1653041.1 hypothetical protein AOBTE_LOCUS18028 [Acanthoscelides obtectus]